MKFFAALVVAAALAPVFAGGYAASHYTQPSIVSQLRSSLKVDEESGDIYLWIGTAGVLKGTTLPAEQVLPYTDKEIRAEGAKRWKWIVASCVNLSTSGDPNAVDDPVSVSHCTRREVTRAEVEAGVKQSTAAPIGSPAA